MEINKHPEEDLRGTGASIRSVIAEHEPAEYVDRVLDKLMEDGYALGWNGIWTAHQGEDGIHLEVILFPVDDDGEQLEPPF